MASMAFLLMDSNLFLRSHWAVRYVREAKVRGQEILSLDQKPRFTFAFFAKPIWKKAEEL
jgi:hypothetical protein